MTPSPANHSIIKIIICILISREGEIWQSTNVANVVDIHYKVVCDLWGWGRTTSWDYIEIQSQQEQRIIQNLWSRCGLFCYEGVIIKHSWIKLQTDVQANNDRLQSKSLINSHDEENANTQACTVWCCDVIVFKNNTQEGKLSFVFSDPEDIFVWRPKCREKNVSSEISTDVDGAKISLSHLWLVRNRQALIHSKTKDIINATSDHNDITICPYPGVMVQFINKALHMIMYGTIC